MTSVDVERMTPEAFTRAVQAGTRMAEAAVTSALADAYARALRAVAGDCARRFTREATPLTAAIGDEYADEQPDPKFVAPDPMNLVPKAKLEAEIERRTREIRAQVVSVTVKGVLTQAGIDFDVGGIFDRKILDKVGARVRDAELSTRDAIRTVIDQAQAEGWTVPETAAEIKAHIVEVSDSTATQLARTDLIGTSNASAIAAARMVFAGENVSKRWLSTPDERTRPTHVEANGQAVPLDSAFTVGDSRLDFPGDPDGPDAEICNCRCVAAETVPSHARVLYAMRRSFEGDLIRIATASGHEASVTPEHPILTRGGWKSAQDLDLADDVVCTVAGDVGGRSPDEDDVPTCIEDLYGALKFSGGAGERVDGSRVNLHGHTPDGEVEVTSAHDGLTLEGDPAIREQFRELVLSLASREMGAAADRTSLSEIGEPEHVGGRSIAKLDPVLNEDLRDSGSPNSCLVGDREHALPPFVGGNYRRGEVVSGGASSLKQRIRAGAFNPSLTKTTVDSAQSDAVLVRDALESAPGFVKFDPVVDLSVVSYSGHVYNLSTADGWYAANGIVTANCTLLFEPETAIVASVWRSLVAAFDPSKHPHRPAGDERGGEWAPKASPSRRRMADVAATAAAVDFTDGSMVCLYVPADIAAGMEAYDGQPAATLHVTLANLPDGVEDPEAAAAALYDAASWHDRPRGTFGGLGMFAEGDNGVPVIALVDVPGLTDLRDAVIEALEEAGVRVSDDHGFVPHVTVGYGDMVVDPEKILGQPLEFPTLSLVVGPERWDMPFGDPVVAADSPRGWGLGPDYKLKEDQIVGRPGGVRSMFDPSKHPHVPAGSRKGGQWAAKVGVTAFRPGDDPATFYDTEKAREFERHVHNAAIENGVTIDSADRVQGYWQGEQEPSYALDVHDGEEGVRAFSEDLRSEWNQDAVVLFAPDRDGPHLAYKARASGDIANALTSAGIDGATIYDGGFEVFGGPDEAAKVLAAADILGIAHGDVEVRAGTLSFVERPVH